MGQVSVHKRGTIQPSNGLTFSPETEQASAKKRGWFLAHKWGRSLFTKGAPFTHQTV
jgi:hypothetical protein